jgi:hypothetical protein
MYQLIIEVWEPRRETFSFEKDNYDECTAQLSVFCKHRGITYNATGDLHWTKPGRAGYPAQVGVWRYEQDEESKAEQERIAANIDEMLSLVQRGIAHTITGADDQVLAIVLPYEDWDEIKAEFARLNQLRKDKP